MLMLVPLLASSSMPMIIGEASAQEEPTGLTPTEIWSNEYANWEFPWGGDSRVQFKEYHDYFSMKERMMRLAENNPHILEFHEGMNGGTNARGEQTTLDDYEGWFYGHASPWMKITKDVNKGEYNQFIGDNGNYENRPDIMLVGNHHAREWMSYETPMFFLETLVFAYDNIGYDNDGDGVIDEDGWDGIDNDGDCHALESSFQDSNGDGIPCSWGDLGVDEDFSEQWVTDLVNTREIYLIPMLNVDGNRYDREVFCGETAWENCPTSGWRKNLRDNTVYAYTPVPNTREEVNEGCDGVDLNRNYEYEWGAPLGATGPLFPGDCYASGVNNDVYNGPPDNPFDDEDGDGLFNEDDVDDNDDDKDGDVDEDPLGGNTEPESRFIQDMTEMNDDNGDGASDYAATLTWHSFSELILYPWGHCTDCETVDHQQLIYHGDKMEEMTGYENMQSSSLYPTTGDFCDWHYGVHDSYCYTIEIGTAFHQHPDDIDHIAVRNVGVPFYMLEIADNPREKADLGMSGLEHQYVQSPDNITIPDLGPIPIDVCIDNRFPYTLDTNFSHVMWRMVKPTRQQSDYGPREWRTTAWSMTPFTVQEESCVLLDGSNGTILQADVPVPDDTSGELHYKVMLGTLSGSFLFEYPNKGTYHTMSIVYRAPYGSTFGSFMLFAIIASSVWGGLGVCLRMMVSDQENALAELDATEEVLDAEEV